MTHTTTPAEIPLQVPRIPSSLDSFGRLPQPWIYLFWIMLSLVDEELTLLVGATMVLGKQGSSEVVGLNLSIFMFLWFT